MIVTAALFVIAREKKVVATYVHVKSPNCRQRKGENIVQRERHRQMERNR